MTRKRYGIQISQEGVPVTRAADYQKVLDDRWPFLDIFQEVEIPVEVRLTDAVESFNWAIELFSHKLGYLPAFTYRILSGNMWGDYDGQTTIVSTKTGIYLTGLHYSGGATSWNFRIFMRVYALDVTREFEYKTEDPEPTSKRQSRKYGAKVIKSGVSPSKFSSDEMSDFSLHTDAKVLAVQQTGVLNMNPWIALDQASVTAIDTGADTMTLAPAFSGADISWTRTLGQACGYYPSDFVTYPSPLGSNTYYIIPTDSNKIKLALGYTNALNGIAIDLASTGSLPGTLSATENPQNPQERIFHNVGYPPSFWMSRVDLWLEDRYPVVLTGGVTPALYGEDIIYDMGRGFEEGFTYATSTYLRFRGAQSVAGGRYAYAIFKDPLERAL
jgi:hypothetical protein